MSNIDLRNKLTNRFKISQEQELERQKHRLNKVITSGLLGSALKGGSHVRSPSVNTISSDDSILSDSHQKTKKKKKKDSDSDISVEQGIEYNIVFPSSTKLTKCVSFNLCRK